MKRMLGLGTLAALSLGCGGTGTQESLALYVGKWSGAITLRSADVLTGGVTFDVLPNGNTRVSPSLVYNGVKIDGQSKHALAFDRRGNFNVSLLEGTASVSGNRMVLTGYWKIYGQRQTMTAEFQYQGPPQDFDVP